MNTLIPRDATGDLSHFQKYYYEPSMAAAIVFIVLFGIATSLHFYQMIRTRTWFMIPFVIGGIFETIGYIGRAISATENPGPYQLGPYIIQSILLLVAPALFAASIYMEFGRIVLMVDGDKKLFIRRTWITKIFVIGDIFSFFMQSTGAGLLSSGSVDSINTGNDIVIAALFLQVAFFGLFVVVTAVFQIRMRKMPTQLSHDRPWKKHMMGLYIVSVLIFIRSIVRCVEYIQGYSGYIMSHEVFLYVFDGAMMFLALLSMNWIHPGEVAKYVRDDKNTEAEKQSGV